MTTLVLGSGMGFHAANMGWQDYQERQARRRFLEAMNEQLYAASGPDGSTSSILHDSDQPGAMEPGDMQLNELHGRGSWNESPNSVASVGRGRLSRGLIGEDSRGSYSALNADDALNNVPQVDGVPQVANVAGGDAQDSLLTRIASAGGRMLEYGEEG